MSQSDFIRLTSREITIPKPNPNIRDFNDRAARDIALQHLRDNTVCWNNFNPKPQNVNIDLGKPKINIFSLLNERPIPKMPKNDGVLRSVKDAAIRSAQYVIEQTSFVNSLLANSDWASAEEFLGRPLTPDEKAAQSISGYRGVTTKKQSQDPAFYVQPELPPVAPTLDINSYNTRITGKLLKPRKELMQDEYEEGLKDFNTRHSAPPAPPLDVWKYSYSVPKYIPPKSKPKKVNEPDYESKYTSPPPLPTSTPRRVTYTSPNISNPPLSTSDYESKYNSSNQDYESKYNNPPPLPTSRPTSTPRDVKRYLNSPDTYFNTVKDLEDRVKNTSPNINTAPALPSSIPRRVTYISPNISIPPPLPASTPRRVKYVSPNPIRGEEGNEMKINSIAPPLPISSPNPTRNINFTTPKRLPVVSDENKHSPLSDLLKSLSGDKKFQQLGQQLSEEGDEPDTSEIVPNPKTRKRKGIDDKKFKPREESKRTTRSSNPNLQSILNKAKTSFKGKGYNKRRKLSRREYRFSGRGFDDDLQAMLDEIDNENKEETEEPEEAKEKDKESKTKEIKPPVPFQGKVIPSLKQNALGRYTVMRDNVPFGIFYIDNNKLQDNILSLIRQTTKTKINDYKNQHISDEVKFAIIQLMQDVYPDLSKVSKEETLFIKELIKRSKLNIKPPPIPPKPKPLPEMPKAHVNHKNKVKSLEIKKLMNQLTLNLGSLKSGNVSKQLSERTRKVIKLLYQLKQLSREQVLHISKAFQLHF